jgi:hypothetical protein
MLAWFSGLSRWCGRPIAAARIRDEAWGLSGHGGKQVGCCRLLHQLCLFLCNADELKELDSAVRGLDRLQVRVGCEGEYGEPTHLTVDGVADVKSTAGPVVGALGFRRKPRRPRRLGERAVARTQARCLNRERFEAIITPRSGRGS